MANYADWIGRRQTTVDTICSAVVRRMAGMMDNPVNFVDGDTLPACWHWLFFNPIEIQSALGQDGHPLRGGFLPPIPQPRRMFAGSRLDWRADFKIGTLIERESTITSVETKSGRLGEMVFVTVQHLYRAEGVVLLEENQEIVYRSESTLAERDGLAALARHVALRENEHFAFARHATYTQIVRPDPVLLFRYSAAAFIGHRIHYDVPYATGVEMYPGLVIHGPLIATMLVDISGRVAAPGRVLKHFEFRAKRPTFDISAFHLHAGLCEADGRVALWSSDNVGEVAVDGWALYDLN